MVKVDSNVRYTYLNTTVTQTGKIVSLTHHEKVKATFALYNSLSKKKKKVFTDKVKLDVGEIVETAPLGLALMGAKVGDIVDMILPEVQGGIHQVKVLDIY